MVATGTRKLQDDEEQPRAHQVCGPASVEHVRDLLEERVPLSLLMDLVAPSGPDSHDILETEGAPEQAWWEQP